MAEMVSNGFLCVLASDHTALIGRFENCSIFGSRIIDFDEVDDNNKWNDILLLELQYLAIYLQQYERSLKEFNLILEDYIEDFEIGSRKFDIFQTWDWLGITAILEQDSVKLTQALNNYVLYFKKVTSKYVDQGLRAYPYGISMEFHLNLIPVVFFKLAQRRGMKIVPQQFMSNEMISLWNI